jgi:hypothetical protein
MRKYLSIAFLLFWYLGLPVLAFIFSPRILQDFKDSDYGLWLAMRSDLWGFVIAAGWAFLPLVAQKMAKWYYWDAILSEKMIAIAEESGNLAAMLKARDAEILRLRSELDASTKTSSLQNQKR